MNNIPFSYKLLIIAVMAGMTLLITTTINASPEIHIEDMNGYSGDTIVDLDEIQPVHVSTIAVKGNKITKERIILREMMFREGDDLPKEDLDQILEQSRENLLNTSLFNFVSIGVEKISDENVEITIEVVERWYIWPVPIVKLGDRNFNVWWETKDFSRLSYGFYIDWRNFRGRRENLITRFQFGYDQLFDFQYLIPYLTQKQKVGIGFGAGFHGNHETAYITEENKQRFYREGSGYARQDIFAFAQVQVRRNIFNTHLFEVRFDQHSFSDSLIIKNLNYSVDQATKQNYLTLYYKFKSDHRDFAPYPLKGYYLDIEAYKYGLGFEGENVPDYFSLLATFRKFWQLSSRFYFGAGINGKYSPSKQQPYYLQKAIGYDRDIVRSYEYYVVDGNSFGVFKSNLKFAIIEQRSNEIGFIRSESFGKYYYAFYANLFVDMGYAYNPHSIQDLRNHLENEYLLGFGAGIDFVTYYDIVLRFEYSVNRMLEHGFFIHLNAPI